jgi:hypothetical protein
VNRRERRVGEASAQIAISVDRRFVGRHREKDRDPNGPTASFFNEADLVRYGEKGFEGFVTEIDDLRRIFVGDKTIEQRDLAVDVANRRRRGLFRQKLLEGFVASIEIERRDSTALLLMKISKESCQQGLADAGAG